MLYHFLNFILTSSSIYTCVILILILIKNVVIGINKNSDSQNQSLDSHHKIKNLPQPNFLFPLSGFPPSLNVLWKTLHMAFCAKHGYQCILQLTIISPNSPYIFMVGLLAYNSVMNILSTSFRYSIPTINMSHIEQISDSTYDTTSSKKYHRPQQKKMYHTKIPSFKFCQYCIQ